MIQRTQARSLRGGRRSAGDRAGPLFLFVLLVSAFVPSVLSEVDTARLLRILEDALAALAKPNPCFESGEPRQLSACLDSPTILQVSDSPMPALVLASASTPGAAARPGRASKARRRRRLRFGSTPRAPPSAS